MVESKNIHPTGIKGLDEVLQGGIPTGNTILLAGSAGTGKTTLALEWLSRGYDKYGEPGTYLGITEPIPKVIRNAQDMDFFQGEASGMHFINLREALDLEKEFKGQKDIEKLIQHIKNSLYTAQPGGPEEDSSNMEKSRLIIDSLSALGYLIDDRKLFRNFIFQLGRTLSDLNCTSFLISEAGEGEQYTKFGIEDYICDGLIYLENIP